MAEENESQLEHILVFGKNRFFCGPIGEIVKNLFPEYSVKKLYRSYRFKEQYLCENPQPAPFLIISSGFFQNGIHRYAKQNNIPIISPTLFGMRIPHFLEYKLKKFKKYLGD